MYTPVPSVATNDEVSAALLDAIRGTAPTMGNPTLPQWWQERNPGDCAFHARRILKIGLRVFISSTTGINTITDFDLSAGADGTITDRDRIEVAAGSRTRLERYVLRNVADQIRDRVPNSRTGTRFDIVERCLAIGPLNDWSVRAGAVRLGADTRPADLGCAYGASFPGPIAVARCEHRFRDIPDPTTDTPSRTQVLRHFLGQADGLPAECEISGTSFAERWGLRRRALLRLRDGIIRLDNVRQEPVDQAPGARVELTGNADVRMNDRIEVETRASGDNHVRSTDTNQRRLAALRLADAANLRLGRPDDRDDFLIDALRAHPGSRDHRITLDAAPTGTRRMRARFTDIDYSDADGAARLRLQQHDDTAPRDRTEVLIDRLVGHATHDTRVDFDVDAEIRGPAGDNVKRIVFRTDRRVRIVGTTAELKRRATDITRFIVKNRADHDTDPAVDYDKCARLRGIIDIEVDDASLPSTVIGNQRRIRLYKHVCVDGSDAPDQVRLHRTGDTDRTDARMPYPGSTTVDVTATVVRDANGAEVILESVDRSSSNGNANGNNGNSAATAFLGLGAALLALLLL